MGLLKGQPLNLSETAAVKSRINILLPIALAIVLPGLGIYSSASVSKPLLESLGFLTGWFAASMVLYILWFAHLRTWRLHGPYKTFWPIVVILLFTLIQAMGYYFFTDFSTGVVIQFGLVRTLLPSIIFLTIQYALNAQKNIGELLLEKEQLQTENYRVRLKALRAQIDPHFMFNSLNTLRSMVRQKHGHAEQFVMSLSDFYRHTLKHDDSITLPLDEELEVLKSYLFLMKSRNGQAVSISLDVDDQYHPFHLPTLALQVIVENCFKHNSMTAKRPLHIDISTAPDGFVQIRNNLQPKVEAPEPSGLGLELIQKRYELLGTDNGLIIDQTESHFTAKLKLITP